MIYVTLLSLVYHYNEIRYIIMTKHIGLDTPYYHLLTVRVDTSLYYHLHYFSNQTVFSLPFARVVGSDGVYFQLVYHSMWTSLAGGIL